MSVKALGRGQDAHGDFRQIAKKASILVAKSEVVCVDLKFVCREGTSGVESKCKRTAAVRVEPNKISLDERYLERRSVWGLNEIDHLHAPCGAQKG